MILATTDGGSSWHQQLKEAAPLLGVDFVDASHGWAVAGEAGPSLDGSGGESIYGAALLRTTDGGATWAQAGEPSSPLGQVDFLDSDQGWGVTVKDTVVRTTDGGTSWQPVAGTQVMPLVSSVCVTAAGGVVWVAAPGQPPTNGTPEVVRSTDGGASWSVSFRGGSGWGSEGADVHCAGSTAWAVFDLSPGAGSEAAVVERTADGGAHWGAVLHPQDEPGGGAPTSVLNHAGPFSVIDGQTARFSEACPPCSGPESSVVATNDGGSSYSTAPLPGSGFTPEGMAFVDADHGFVAASTPPNDKGPATGVQVFATSDGGRSWTIRLTTE